MGKVIPFRKRTNWTKADAYAPQTGKRRGGGPKPPRNGGSAGRLGRIAAILVIAAVILVSTWWQADEMFGPPAGSQVSQTFGTCGEKGRGTYCTSDGDTVTIGYGKTARRIRLTGYDAPEIEGACPAESAKAREAEMALRSWLNAGPFEWDGGTQPPRDQYGRELRYAWRTAADGSVEYLATHMIDAGLASGDGWGQSADWCG